MLKTCSKCKIEKPFEDFNNLKSSKDGKRYWCRSCQREEYIQHKQNYFKNFKKYYNENKESIKEYKKKWYEENKEHTFNYKAIWYLANHKRLFEKRIGNVDELSRKSSIYRKTPRGKMKAARSSHRRRSIIKETECNLTASQWEKIIRLQENKCVICGRKFTNKNRPTKDHIIPVYHNGGFTMENTQAVHRSCNTKKGKKIDVMNIISWIQKPELCSIMEMSF